MILKMCRRCRKMIVHPNIYCTACFEVVAENKAENKKQSNRNYNQKRDKKYTAFYNSIQWGVLRDKKMQDEQYRCENCGKIATEVHHKKPIQTEEGWELRLEYNNLETLCLDCHNLRHNRFQRRR